MHSAVVMALVELYNLTLMVSKGWPIKACAIPEENNNKKSYNIYMNVFIYAIYEKKSIRLPPKHPAI